MIKQKNGFARKGRKPSRRVESALAQQPLAAYADEVRVKLKLPGDPTILTTTVTTGLISQVIGSDPLTYVPDFNLRLAATFDTFRVVGVDYHIRPLTVSTGLTAFMMDENDNTAPVADESAGRVGKRLPNTNSGQKLVVMRWRVKEMQDLDWRSTANSYDPVYLKVYTSTALWGAPAVATALWVVQPVLYVEFRGLKSL